jgi:hypothetical protein
VCTSYRSQFGDSVPTGGRSVYVSPCCDRYIGELKHMSGGGVAINPRCFGLSQVIALSCRRRPIWDPEGYQCSGKRPGSLTNYNRIYMPAVSESVNPFCDWVAKPLRPASPASRALSKLTFAVF